MKEKTWDTQKSEFGSFIDGMIWKGRRKKNVCDKIHKINVTSMGKYYHEEKYFFGQKTKHLERSFC